MSKETEDFENEQLAIITNPHFGFVDNRGPALQFTVNLLRGGALIVLTLEETIELIEEHFIEDISQLHREPCVVKTQDPGSICEFVKLHHKSTLI